MDFQEFYVEQDRRMSLPEEDFNDYLQRMNVSRQPLSETGATLSKHESTPRAGVKERNMHSLRHVEQEPKGALADFSGEHEMQPIDLIENDATALDASRRQGTYSSPSGAVKAIASDLPSQLRELATTITSCKQQFQLLEAELSPNTPDRLEMGQGPENHRISSHSPGRDPDIVEAHESVPLSSAQFEGSTKPLKRKASDDVNFGARPRKRSNESIPPNRASSPMEDITSFSTCPRPRRASIEVRPVSKHNAKSKATTKQRKILALDLRPMLLAPRQRKDPEEIKTSPIEDDSFSAPQSSKSQAGTMKVPKAASSLMLLDIQDRVIRRLAEKKGKASTSSMFTQEPSSAISISSSDASRPSSPDLEQTATSAQAVKKTATKTKPRKKTQKEKPALMTPEEYATSLIASVAPREGGGLTGTTIYYTGGDMQYASERTRGRMNLILRHGGSLVSKYDPRSVTHIVTDAQRRPTLRALGLKSLDQIPEHIPTVTWNWVASRMNKKPDLDACYDKLFMETAFPERIEAGYKVDSKGKGKAIDEEEISHISEFTYIKPLPKHGQTPTIIHDSDSEDGDILPGPHNLLPSPPDSPSQRIVPSAKDDAQPTLRTLVKREPVEDPLAEFYAKARSRADSKWSLTEESDAGASSGVELDAEEPVNEPSTSSNKSKRWKWTCDKQPAAKGSCPNQDIIDKLEELKELHQAKVGDDEHWRVFSYNKCIRALRSHPKRISSFAEARSIRGVGDKTAAKIMEILQTGDLRRIGYEKTADVEITKLFQGIYGVGRATAYQWYAAGCRTLADLTGGSFGIQLTPAQQIGVKFYSDINDRMPREETKQLFDLIKPIALKIDPALFVEVMGSYRRGKSTCGDIDILITRDPSDGKTHEGVLPRLLGDLHTASILTEDLALPESENDLENIYRGLCRLPHQPDARRRRIDFLTVPWQSRGAALLYYTGDDIFNRAMRMKANKMGYSLNQRGLFSGVVRDPSDRRIKLNKGSLLASETEQEIFKILDVPWQEPHERVRG